MLSDIAATIEALAQVLPILLLLLLGILLRRLRFLKAETVAELKKLVVNVTLPALLFLAFSQVTLEAQYLLVSLSVFAACALVMLLARVPATAGKESVYFPFLMTGFEAGMMGYAIFGAVYGNSSLFKFGIVDLGQVVFVFFVMVPLLERLSSGGQAFRDTVKGFFSTPVIVAILAGIIFNEVGLAAAFTEHPLSASVLEGVSLVGALTTPLVTMAIGYEIELRAGNLRRPAITVAVRLAVWIAIGIGLSSLLINRFLGLDREFQAAVLTMFILPPPFVLPLFMENAALRDRDYVLNTLTIATVVTLFAFSVVSTLYPPGG